MPSRIRNYFIRKNDVNMEEIKQGWKKRGSLLLVAITIVILYKLLDNFTSVKQWIGTFLGILKPFLIGLLLSYILFMPCRKIESAYKKSKIKFMSKRCRGLSVITTYIIFVLIIIIVINCILPVLRESIVELFANIPNYYNKVVNEYDNLPEESFLKSDIIKEKVSELRNIDINQLFNINGGKIIEYVKNIIDVFSGIFDVFVSVVVSVYILLQRTEIIRFLRRFARAILSKQKYEAFDKYFTNGNEVFFSFVTAQLVDAIVVGILTTLAMLVLNVKYAPLLGFTIGLFNLIPYIGAIVAVTICIIITLITGGIGKAIAMAIVVIILQQVDANIINPRILGSSLEISPLLVIFAVTIGGAYFGIIGMFLGVPIAVVIKEVVCDFVDNKNRIKDEEENKIET